MTASKLVRSTLAHRTGAILAAAVLLAVGSRHADAAGSTSGFGESSATATASATSSPSASVTHTSTSSSKAISGAATSSSAAAECPDQVQVTLGRMSVSNGMVTISFSHNGHGCPAALPTRLHIHQNLLMTPQAGSDPVHQRNTDYDIGPDSAETVTEPLLESADGKCFVQVDAHASGQARGQFFPTTTCSSAPPTSPATSSTVPSSTAPSSTAPSSTAPSSTAPSSTAPGSTAHTSTAPVSTSAAPSTTNSSVLPASTSRTTTVLSFVPTGQVGQSPSTGSLASTGSPVAFSFGLAALLLIAGASLMVWSGRPRRH